MAQQQTVAALLSQLVLQEAPMTAQRSMRLRGGRALADVLPVAERPAARTLHVHTLDEFLAQTLQHTERLPPVLCSREDMRAHYPASPPHDMGAFSAHVFGPVRLAAAVLGHLGHVRVAHAMLNADDEDGTGSLLYAEEEIPRMLVLGLSPRHFTSDEVRAFGACNKEWGMEHKLSSAGRVWLHLADQCQKNKVRHFAVCTYEAWIFGCFADGYWDAWISPHILCAGTQPTVIESLCYWIDKSRDAAPESAHSASVSSLPSARESGPKTAHRVRFAHDDRPVSPLPPRDTENVHPRTPTSSPRKRRAAASADDLPLTPTPSPRKRRADDPPPTPTPSPRKRRVDDPPPSPTPSPRKRSPGKKQRREPLVPLTHDAEVEVETYPTPRSSSPLKIVSSDSEEELDRAGDSRDEDVRLSVPRDVGAPLSGFVRRYQRGAAAVRRAFLSGLRT